MKHIFLFAAFLFSLAAVKAQHAQAPGLSPLTKIYLDKTARGQKLPDGYVYKQGTNGELFISALVKASAAVDVPGLGALGVKIGTRAGNIWTVQIPVDKVTAFTQIGGLDYIQLDEPVSADMDSVRKLTRVDSVHAGLGALTMPYTGKNVVVGIIDAGFDYRHPAFFDTAGTSYRVRKIWEQQKPGTPPSGFSYGNEITDSAVMWSTGYDALISHGSHVAGIAAGSGIGSVSGTSQFRGVDYDADIVMVGITPSPSNWTSTGMTDIIDAMNYIYSYAASVGKPAVANLSWGCSIGPHDGLSLFSQACDNLTGAGKIFVCSAGNNGDQKLHIRKQFTSADTLVRTVLNFDPGLSERRSWIDIWGDSSSQFCLQLSLYHVFTRVDSTGFICLDGQVHNLRMIGSNGDTAFATITGVASDFNGKPRIFVDIYSKVSDRVMVSIKGIGGKVDMWNGYVKNTTGYYGDFITGGFAGAVGGNTDMTIGDMAASRSALAVAAYASKTSFTNVSGGGVSYSSYATLGDLAPFSSLGPTADARVKPDISAPGLIVGSAVNSYDPTFQAGGSEYSAVVRQYTDPQNSRLYSYGMLMGTSMSSPVASGIVALMLEANPSLTPADVQSILAQTAIEDGFTGNLPSAGDNSWGHGKINAMGAVAAASLFAAVNEVYARPVGNFTVYPNPAAGEINIGYHAKADGRVTYSICDMMGRSCISSEYTGSRGDNIISINTSGLSKGIYYLVLYSARFKGIQKVVIE